MPLRIMAINASKEILELYYSILTNEGYEVFVYSFRPNDLQEVERVKPDILILDLLPGRSASGWELLQKVKMNRTTAHIPIILCTTQVKMVQDMEEFLATKRVAVVIKPFDIDDLLKAVKQAETLAQIIESPDDKKSIVNAKTSNSKLTSDVSSMNVPSPIFSNTSFDLVVIAVSLGGLNALSQLLSSLPATFPAAIAIAQHFSNDAPMLLADLLVKRTTLTVKWAEDQEQLQAGIVYIAPPGVHLLIAADHHLVLSSMERVNSVRPSGDILFESAANVFKSRLIGIVLTGLDGDGSKGIQIVKHFGGVTFAQDEASSKAFSMPHAAIKTGDVDYVLPLDEIGPKLLTLIP